MEPRYVYFIERIDTNEWYYCKHEQKEGYTVHDFDMWLIPSWTKDPLIADGFASRENAEAFAKYDTVFDRKIEYEITEHEFVFIKQPSRLIPD